MIDLMLVANADNMYLMDETDVPYKISTYVDPKNVNLLMSYVECK